jgi:hypothetical protein
MSCSSYRTYSRKWVSEPERPSRYAGAISARRGLSLGRADRVRVHGPAHALVDLGHGALKLLAEPEPSSSRHCARCAAHRREGNRLARAVLQFARGSTGGRKNLAGYRWFESISLQRGVSCEPDFLDDRRLNETSRAVRSGRRTESEIPLKASRSVVEDGNQAAARRRNAAVLPRSIRAGPVQPQPNSQLMPPSG